MIPGLGRPRPLADGDDLGSFESGVAVVDSWARARARSAVRNRTACVFVVTKGREVVGLYSLSTHSVARVPEVVGRLRRNAPDPIPCTLLGMLGVAREWQGRGLGTSLLRDAYLRALDAASSVASRALVVDPADEAAEAFYRHFGFLELGIGDRMYLRF